MLLPITDVKAESFSGYLAGKNKISNGKSLGTTNSRYLKMTVQADSKDASYTVSLVGANSYSSINMVSPINTSVRKFTGKKKYTIYILPHSGMGCPSDADHCFGAGASLINTEIIQGNECNGNRCQLYGVRINNKKIIAGYNVNVSYDFYN